jgi:DNA-binding NtrC family response regulator
LNAEPASASILVVDNNMEFSELLAALLRSEGFDVCHARDFAAARSFLAARRFDVVLCDMHLGDEFGLDLVREQWPVLARNKTAAIGMSADESHRSACKALGVSFMLKTIDFDDLLALIRRSRVS